MIIRTNVISSNISSIGYEDGILEIQFNDGSIYNYFNVPVSVYNSLMSAGSHGKYLAENIKNRFDYSKIM